MSGVSLFGYTLWKDSPAKIIHKSFQQYQTKLDNQKRSMSDTIHDWGQALINSINQYVDQQVYLIEREHARQLRQLDGIRDQFYAELNVHEQNKNNEQINQLLEKCKTLKFQIAAFETNTQTIPFMAIPRNKKKTLDRTDAITNEPGDDLPENIAETNGDNGEENDKNGFSFVYKKSLSFNNNEAARTSFEDSSEHDQDNQSRRYGNARESFDKRDEILLEKCPLCMMIFPVDMTKNERKRHVEEHYQDES